MPAQQQEKPMRYVMVFTRAFRAPLQATFHADDSEALDDMTSLLEMADKRSRHQTPTRED